jgi:hypothetical protein
MASRPNYYQERATRERVKDSRKQEKLRKREEAAAERKASRDKTPGEADKK